jgi:hypothetical protein
MTLTAEGFSAKDAKVAYELIGTGDTENESYLPCVKRVAVFGVSVLCPFRSRHSSVVQVSLFFAIFFFKAVCAIKLQHLILKLKSMQAWLAFGVFVFSMSTAQGLWSTAQLSTARENLAATSVGSVALFAGGLKSGCAL